jgi:hypothetical protein
MLWNDSDSMADEPVTIAATILVIATRKFPMSAAQTVLFVVDCAILFAAPEPGGIVPEEVLPASNVTPIVFRWQPRPSDQRGRSSLNDFSRFTIAEI